MRASERGVTLMEMMVTMAVMTIVMGGIVMFLASHARMSAGAFDRSDIQRSGRGALTVLEEKIGKAGLGLPKILAIKSYTAVNGETGACPNSPKLEVAALDYERQWKVSGTAAGTNDTITLTAAIPEPLKPDSSSNDIAIDGDSWMFIYHGMSQDVGSSPAFGPNRGHGMVQVDPRALGDTTIDIVSTNYSAAQLDLDLDSGAEINQASNRDPVVLRADVSGFGLDCSNVPYLYWENNGTKVPVASNVATAGMGLATGEVGLRFRFFLDLTGPDGVPDGIGDTWEDDATNPDPGTLVIDPAGNTGEQDNVTAIEVTLVLRSDTPDPQLEDYRTETFTMLIQTPNIHTQVDPGDDLQLERYFFVDNSGLQGTPP